MLRDTRANARLKDEIIKIRIIINSNDNTNNNDNNSNTTIERYLATNRVKRISKRPSRHKYTHYFSQVLY